MAYNGRDISRRSVEDADPLEFNTAPSQAGLARVSLVFHGVSVDLDLALLTESRLAELERRIDKLLQRPGWSAPAPPGGRQEAPGARPGEDRASRPANRPAARQNSRGGRQDRPRQPPPASAEPPLWDGGGDPLCPYHDRRLKGPNRLGRHYCTFQDQNGDYCDYKVDLEALDD